MRYRLRIVFTVLAVVLAYGAQLLLDGRWPQTWTQDMPPAAQVNLAGVLYVAAMVLFGLGVSPAESIPEERDARSDSSAVAADDAGAHTVPLADRPQAAWRPSETLPRWLPLGRLVSMLVAIGLGAASSAIFWSDGESALVRWLWSASVVVLILSQLPWPIARPEMPRGWRWWGHVLLALGVVVAAFVLRFYRLQDIPQDLHGDMASHGLEARGLLLGWRRTLFGAGFADIPIMAFVPAALSMALFGDNLFGLGMTSVIGGTLTVVGLYLLVREAMAPPAGRRVALLSAALLAISYVHIHFSRIAEYMDPWPFAVFSLYLLTRGMRRRRPLCFVGSGVLMALSFQMYYSGRVLPVLAAAYVLYLALFQRDLVRGNWRGLVLVVLAAVLTTGPMIPFFLRHGSEFASRSREVILLNPPVMTHLMGKYGVSTPGAVVREQIKRSLLMFHWSIDSSTQFGLAEPMLDSYTSPLLVLGLAVALRRLRHPLHGLALIWLSLILIIGSAVTDNAPFWPRLVGILPVAVLLAALAIERIWALVEQAWGEKTWVVVSPLLVAALIFVGANNWRLYVRAVEDNAMPRARIGRFLGGLDADISACLLTDPYELGVREIAFLAYPHATFDLPSDAHGGALDACPGPRRAFVLTDNHLDVLPELIERYPGGVTEEHREANGTLVFVSYISDSTGQEAPLASQLPGIVEPPIAQRLGFEPRYVYQGTTESRPLETVVGDVTVTDGTFTVLVGAVTGQHAVFDYLRFVGRGGEEYRFEAEDPAVTSGDTFSPQSGEDGHWWLQDYEPFSGGRGLVSEEPRGAPTLTSSVHLPDGDYVLMLGTFTGDPASGSFAVALGY